ncbi:hypothetical protein J1N35_041612 [Gossypium stocksii]|uniref:Uncharacterized protein n=1 Tax=Gossypium stocksii TaxID=47602 RepID=A0A9D3ZJV9_9ROSI|nr:hypothetical protein J1N35_041612 [Gossypium stocksii]
MQFLCTHISPALNVSNINAFRAILLYGVLQRKQICVKRWIYRNMKQCISGQKESIPDIKEFVLQNNIREPNYLSNIYTSGSIHIRSDEQRSENEEEEEEEATEHDIQE